VVPATPRDIFCSSYGPIGALKHQNCTFVAVSIKQFSRKPPSCTLHVHVFKAKYARKMCCCTQYVHAPNMCTCERTTCLHMLQYATCARVHVRNVCACFRQDLPVCTCMCLAMGLAIDQHVHATCARVQLALLHEVHVRVHMEHGTCKRVKVKNIVMSCTSYTQHSHVSKATTFDLSTCTEDFTLPSIIIGSRWS
jgi:hypothetical protein